MWTRTDSGDTLRAALAKDKNDRVALTSVGIDDITWKQAPYIVGSGACMGTADVVPGVSGGTMAVALGIYARLLAAIASINTHSLRALLRFDFRRVLQLVHWRFVVCLVAGLATAVVIMLKVVKLPHLIETKPTFVYAVFFGLVLASAIVLARRLPEWTVWRGALLVLGAAMGFAVVNLVPVQTPEHPAFIFLCGVISICAMLLPGISGSFVLLILGKYEYILNSVSQLLRADLTQLGVVVPFALGCAVGIAAFARFLGWLLNKHEHPVIAWLVGLLIGSLWRIWPYQRLTTAEVRGKTRVIGNDPYFPESFEVGVAVLIVVGLATVLCIEHLAARRARQEVPA